MDDLAVFHDLASADERGVDLGRAALAVARIEHPALSIDAEIARLDALAARSAAAATGDAQKALERLLAFLFEDEGFRGNAAEYYDPRNSCLNDVLDRKLGIPITLSVLTMEVGRRVGIEVDGVSLPGHFIVSANLGARRIFLDPFNGGAVLTPAQAAEVASRAVGRPVKLEEGHWAPCGKRPILVRMLRNLKGIYARREDWERALGAIQPSVHAPLGTLGGDVAKAALAGLDPRKETVVYCAGGVRSLKALGPLRDAHGFKAIRSLKGGFKAWAGK